jgi:hypothetical protein
MSRIYFHSSDGDAEVRGSERAYFSMLINNIALAILDPKLNRKRLEQIIVDKDSYVLREKDDLHFANTFEIWFSVSMGARFQVNEKIADSFEIALNTAHIMGNDPIKLATRIHGQCEIYCYVEANNKNWLAEIIEKGMKTKIYRANQGWEDVISLLKSSKDSPIVLSYSVCDQFPSASAANYSDYEGWYDLSDEQKWNMGIEGIRKEHGLEMKPDNWDSFFFMNGITAFDAVAN